LSVFVVLVLAFSALSAPVSRAAMTTPDTNATFSTLRIGSLQEPDSLNPNVGVLSASYSVWAHVYELLVGIGIDLTPVPALAQSWEVSADNLTWTFHLQNNVTWHDGEPFTAEDVNFTFRQLAPASPGNPVGCDLTLLSGYLGGVDVENIRVVDPYTIEIPTVSPKANILSMFIQILPKHIWSAMNCQQAEKGQNRPPIGTGMYKWTAWHRGAYTQLDLYPQYWRLDPAQDYVDQIIIIYYKDSTSLYNAFISGAIDATSALTSVQFLQVPDKVQGSATNNVQKYNTSQISFGEVGMCVASDQLIADWGAGGGRSWLLANLTVRQAIQLSVNRSFLVDNIIAGLGEPGSTIVAPATAQWHYDVPPAEEYPYDPPRARALLDDPQGDGFTLRAGQTIPGLYGENLDPAAANNQDAFIDTNSDNVRDVVDPNQVIAGDQWGPAAPNRPDLTLTIQVIDYDTEGSDAADRMVQWWADVGIHVTKLIVTENVQIQTTYDCAEDMYIWGWGGDVDPDFILSIMTTDQILYWQDAWYSDPTYDQLYLDQQTQVDFAERQATILEMQRILYHDAPYLVLWYPYALAVVRTDKFSGWGDWTAYPGLGLTGFGNDFIMLTLRSGVAPANNCPQKPVIEGDTGTLRAFVNETKVFSATSGDADADNLTWIWSWDDGNATTLMTPPNVNETFAPWAWNTPGFYNVTVSVDDNLCAPVTSDPRTVEVLPLPAEVGYVAGTVRDATTSAPIGGAAISVSPGGFGSTTNPLGGYNVTLPLGTYAVTATRDLYATETRTGIAVTANNTTTVDFQLDPLRGWIAGTVTSSTGGDLAGVTITAVGARTYTATTNATGRYNLTVAPGTYSVSARLEGYGNQTTSGVSVTNGATTTVNFVLVSTAPAPGLNPLVVAGIGLAVLLVVLALVAWLIIRKRRKAEEIQGPPMPPQSPPPPGT
jgi:peptide/nickel transport system substrate-binding protein